MRAVNPYIAEDGCVPTAPAGGRRGAHPWLSSRNPRCHARLGRLEQRVRVSGQSSSRVLLCPHAQFGNLRECDARTICTRESTPYLASAVNVTEASQASVGPSVRRYPKQVANERALPGAAARNAPHTEWESTSEVPHTLLAETREPKLQHISSSVKNSKALPVISD